MTDEQYWECDVCQERFPRSFIPASRNWNPIELSDTDNEGLWLCKTCADTIPSKSRISTAVKAQVDHSIPQKP